MLKTAAADPEPGSLIPPGPAQRGSLFRSVFWLGSEKILRAAGALAIGVLVARYLGPDNYGRLGVALALATLGKGLVSLYLELIIRRDLAAHPEKSGVIAGTYFLTALPVGLLVAAGLFLYAGFRVDDSETRLMVFVLSWLVPLQALGIADLWFESQCTTRPMVMARNIAWGAGMALRILLVVSHAPTLAFPAAILAELSLSAALVWSAFRRRMPPAFRLRWDGRLLLSWVRENWSVFAIAAFSLLCDQIRIVVTQHTSGNGSAGNLGISLRLVEAWWAVFMLLATVTLPRITVLLRENAKQCREFMQFYADCSLVLPLVVAAIATITFPWILPWLFGSAYSEAAPCTIAMLWGAPPSFMGICRGQYFAATHRISMDFPTVLTKSILTVTLTFAWTPAHGAVGAAWAATTAAWIGTYLVPWFQPSLRTAFPEQWRAFLAPLRFGRYAGMIPALFQRSWAEATSVLKPSAEAAGPGDPPRATPPS